MARAADRRSPDQNLSGSLLARRSHGSLETIVDSEHRPLRPIGATAREVAARTGMLLSELLAVPSVRIFQGVRCDPGDRPRVAHAVNAGPMLVLVESVAWPPGRYATTTAGHVLCDGVYTGQSVGPLVEAVRHWRAMLPQGHWVRAVVVVYPTGEGRLRFPGGQAQDLAWTGSASAVNHIRGYLPSGRPVLSVPAISALVAATGPADGG